jgi:hypothetical protein
MDFSKYGAYSFSLAFTATCRYLETVRYVRAHVQEYRKNCKAIVGLVYGEVAGQEEAADDSGQLPDIFTGFKAKTVRWHEAKCRPLLGESRSSSNKSMGTFLSAVRIARSLPREVFRRVRSLNQSVVRQFWCN